MKSMPDKIAEIFLDTTKKVLALADKYGKDRNETIERAAETFYHVTHASDFSEFPIGGDD